MGERVERPKNGSPIGGDERESVNFTQDDFGRGGMQRKKADNQERGRGLKKIC